MDGRLGRGVQDSVLQAMVSVQLQTYRDTELWRSPWVLVAGGLLVLLGLAGALTLVFRARRRRA